MPVTAFPTRTTSRKSHAPLASASIRVSGNGGPRSAEPITMGVPLPKGLCTDPERLAVIGSDGRAMALQVRVTDRWPDGSIRWALLDFQSHMTAALDAVQFVVRPVAERVAPSSPVVVRIHDEAIEIDTGAAQFLVAPGSNNLFRSIVVGGRDVIAPDRTGLSLETDVELCKVCFDAIALEEEGQLRTVVYATGRALTARGARVVDLETRMHFFAGSATVRIATTIRNPRAVRHFGGFWELGDPGNVLLRDVAFSIALADTSEEKQVRCSLQAPEPLAPVALPFEVYQESSGGAEWKHPNHRNRAGVVPMRWRGYRVRSAAIESRGERATPIVEVQGFRHVVTVTLPTFWQNFPKAIEADATSITVRLFPAQFADVHELQGGEQKTHTFYVAFAPDTVTSIPLDWCRTPLRATLPPSWYCDAQPLPYLVPQSMDAQSDHDALVDAGVSGKTGFLAKRETIDEYGWRNFGELYADHEAVFQPDAKLVSHYNNQYDAVAGFAAQFMRTGDVRWWELMDDLARHVVDIDIYHTDRDKSAYNHALFWHTSHYVDAGRSTHRSYPKAPRVGGGGPSNEHNYATGLVLHYFLTGDPQSRDAALELAQWVIHMDDGRATMFKWLSTSATGLASQTSSTDYHGPGRGAGHSIRALLDGHRLSDDRRFLLKAEELIRRVVHPADDLPARNLLDTERRWSYTACLQAIGAYLDHKAERSEFDWMYAYARATLLHYARWMADHEYPYLDKPEVLEYPTETWAAQDLRKSDVFYFAAQHSTGGERERYLERASFFYRTAISTLAGMPTRALTRPLILLLSQGRLNAWVKAKGLAAQPPTAADGYSLKDFGAPEQFVPQKQRVKRLLVRLAAGGLSLLVAATGFFLAK
jgi:hypothetical protein